MTGGDKGHIHGTGHGTMALIPILHRLGVIVVKFIQLAQVNHRRESPLWHVSKVSLRSQSATHAYAGRARNDVVRFDRCFPVQVLRIDSIGPLDESG